MYKSIVEGKGGISAKVVADSIANDIRIITMELRYHRFFHSEMMTHRMFSRNASSSRAIPVAKMIEQVKKEPAMPIHFGKNRAGMQAHEEIDHPHYAKDEWGWAVEDMVYRAGELSEYYNVHKQIVNRLLEPFQFITVVVTATEWDNFFALRNHPAAQPEIQELAKVMIQAQGLSSPKKLNTGEWHLPYITETVLNGVDTSVGVLALKDAIKCSAARCARVSYLKHDGTSPSIEDDLELYNMLVTRPYTDKRGTVFTEHDPIHASPCEHSATPMVRVAEIHPEPENWDKGITHADKYGNLWSGNFRGWIQYRQIL